MVSAMGLKEQAISHEQVNSNPDAPQLHYSNHDGMLFIFISRVLELPAPNGEQLPKICKLEDLLGRLKRHYAPI